MKGDTHDVRAPLRLLRHRPKLGDWCRSNANAQFGYQNLSGIVTGFYPDEQIILTVCCLNNGALHYVGDIPFSIDELDLLTWHDPRNTSGPD